MRCFIKCLGLLITIVAAGQRVQASETTWSVEPRTKGNVITLEVTNRLPYVLSDVSMAVEHTPEWISVTEQSISSQTLFTDSTAIAQIIFDVHENVASGEQGAITVGLGTEGRTILRKSISLTTAVPEHYELSQNYPNPFNPTTKIEFALPKDSHVTVKVYDVLGREIRTVLDEERPAGFFSTEWDGKNDFRSDAASGTYFYRLQTVSTTDNRTFSALKKMILLK